MNSFFLFFFICIYFRKTSRVAEVLVGWMDARR